jgi:hypothetical protein
MTDILLKIRPSKTKEESKAPKRGPLLMEQAFAAMHDVQRKGGKVNLELGMLHDKICFFVRTSAKFASMVEGQMYAQYPDIDAEQIDPAVPNVQADEVVHSCLLRLSSPDVFPIKRHPQFDDLLNRVTIDPLSGISSTLAKYPQKGMRGHIAISIQPIGSRYRRRVLKFLPLLSKGLPKKWNWYRMLFTRVHCARGWKRLALFPLDVLMGGFRSIFHGVELQSALSTTMTESRRDTLLEREVQSSSRSHDREDDLQGAKDKMNKLLFKTIIQLSVIAGKHDANAARIKLQEMISSFKQFDLPHSNSFVAVQQRKTSLTVPPLSHKGSYLLSHEELATIWHLPTVLVKTPNIDWVMSRKLEPPNELPIEGNLTLIGESVFRSKRTKFGIKQDDRRRHTYTIGKTGMGKSTLLENMIFSDIHAGNGLAVLDPHGDLADAVLRMIPKERTNDVVLFDPTDTEYPISFNMLECKSDAQRPLITSGLMGVFTKIWPDVWSGRMEHILRNTLLALLESPGNSMLGIMRMYADNAFKDKVVEHLTDPLVRSFWEDEYGSWTEKFRSEAVAAIQNKVGQLLSTPIIRNIVGQVSSSLDIRHAIDSKKIIIANLSKGKLGEDNSSFLGSMLVTKFQIDAMSRADIPEHERHDFYLYVDEFQNFATNAFATILSEARKYRLNLTMANQYIGQLSPDKSNTMLRDAVFGNVGSIVSFQVGSEDAEEIAKQFGDESLIEDIVGLPKYHAYMRLMIDGITSHPFSVATLPPPTFEQDVGRVEKIRAHSRERYAMQRSIVEDKIKKWALSAKESRGKQKSDAKVKEKELEEIKKAKKKGMKLAEYRTWRDREMWTNSYNALKKKLTNEGSLSDAEKKEMEELQKKISTAGGPTVRPADPERSRRAEPGKNAEENRREYNKTEI